MKTEGNTQKKNSLPDIRSWDKPGTALDRNRKMVENKCRISALPGPARTRCPADPIKAYLLTKLLQMHQV